jgi:hypothetical protein
MDLAWLRSNSTARNLTKCGRPAERHLRARGAFEPKSLKCQEKSASKEALTALRTGSTECR